jgi:hypothetical protein
MDVASSKKGVKKSTFTEASTKMKKKAVWVLKKFLEIDASASKYIGGCQT